MDAFLPTKPTTFTCWVYGEDICLQFGVELQVSNTTTVADLKTIIKKERSIRFHNVDAAELALYSIAHTDVGITLSQWNPDEQTPHCSISPLRLLNLSDSLVIVVETGVHFIIVLCCLLSGTLSPRFSHQSYLLGTPPSQLLCGDFMPDNCRSPEECH